MSYQAYPLAQIPGDDRYAKGLNRIHRKNRTSSRRRRYAVSMHPAVDHLEPRTLLTTRLGQIHLPVDLAHEITILEAGEDNGRSLAHALAEGKREHNDHILATTKEMKLTRDADRQKELLEARVRHNRDNVTVSHHAAARVKTEGTTAFRRGNAGRPSSQAQVESTANQSTIASAQVVTPAASTPPTTETLNVQLQAGDAGALSQLMPLITAAGATTQPTSISGLYNVQGSSTDMARLASDLSANPAVQYADPMQMFHAADAPNDPDYANGDQWTLNGNWGTNAPTAWNTTTGSTDVIVADVDSGIDYNHPDLYDNVWLNQAEIPSSVRPNLADVNGDGLITLPEQFG